MNTHKRLIFIFLVSTTFQMYADEVNTSKNDAALLEQSTPEGVIKKDDTTDLEKVSNSVLIPLDQLVPEEEIPSNTPVDAHRSSCNQIARMLVSYMLETNATPEEAFLFLGFDKALTSDRALIQKEALRIAGTYNNEIWEASKVLPHKDGLAVNNRAAKVEEQLSNSNCLIDVSEPWSDTAKNNRLFTASVAGGGAVVGVLFAKIFMR